MSNAPVRPTISIDILNQVDIRVGTIEAVEDVEGSDKLLKMRVNFGEFSRTIVAGMKQERANPKEVEGRQALFVVNSSRERCAASCPRECCLILATRTASGQSWPCRKIECRMARAQGKLGDHFRNRPGNDPDPLEATQALRANCREFPGTGTAVPQRLCANCGELSQHVFSRVAKSPGQ